MQTLTYSPKFHFSLVERVSFPAFFFHPKFIARKQCYFFSAAHNFRKQYHVCVWSGVCALLSNNGKKFFHILYEYFREKTGKKTHTLILKACMWEKGTKLECGKIISPKTFSLGTMKSARIKTLITFQWCRDNTWIWCVRHSTLLRKIDVNVTLLMIIAYKFTCKQCGREWG